MKHSATILRGMTLLAAGGLFCLAASSAQCQRAGRRAAQTSGTAMSCPTNGTSTSSTSTTTQGTTTSGTTTGTTSLASTGAVTAQTSQFLAQSSASRAAAFNAQRANGFSAQITSSNQALVQWSGVTTNAQRVYIGVLDANGQVIDQRALTQLPVQANLTLTNSARYFGVRVVYANGASRTFYSPIR